MNTIRRVTALLACAILVPLSVGAAPRPSRPHATPARTAQASDLRASDLRASDLRTSDLRTSDLRTSDVQTSDDEVFRYYRSVVRIGQNYTLRGGEVVRDVRTFFGDVTLEGSSEHDVVVVFGKVHAKNTAVINGSLVVVGGSATIDPGATVGQDLVVLGGTLTAPADFSPRGEHVVVGSPGLANALNSVLPWITRGLLWGRVIVPDLRWVWALVGLAFLVYLAINTLFDWPVGACADAIGRKPLTAFLMGLLVLVLSVPALVILAATVIGLAIVPFVVCAMFAGALVGKAGVARAIGATLVAQPEPGSKLQSFRSFLIGSVVIALAYMVPVLGLVAWALTTVVGIGAAALMLRTALRREHPRREREAAVPMAVPPPPAPQTMMSQPRAAIAEEPQAEVSSQQAQPVAAAPVAPPPPPAGDFALFPRASFLDRVVAFAIDCVLVGIAVQVFDFRHDGSFPLMLFAYHLAFWAWKGTTLGGIVVGLRVVRTPGTEVRFADALVRVLASILSLAALGIGCFWMLQDPERQMWHDKIAGTVVVRVPRELVLA